ncbi:1,4-alpha-glucan branching protein GlgB [Desulfitobacterium sp.]|uniref:1,4-alpha-glucan branching protein GlgB n=1 Tax=Desulfitobacterium sp. TaxID=49981 RepID=UPI002CBE50BF|nr:1,4-alpha-glucan branching protein GlgB [Desulfitobacterium sp.]HVJ49016.1 1,4-alpha-glucan branching protein GlgB [Desulfitobacterium sp.]
MSNTEFITAEELYFFNEGKLHHSYLRFGAHVLNCGGIKGTHFAVWAPNALKVSVVGDFNDWCGRENFMIPAGESGVWTLFIPGLKEGDLYKYEITTQEKTVLLKADPFAFSSEKRPSTASIIYSLTYPWQDQGWMMSRWESKIKEKPLLIYEVHLGSWKRNEDSYEKTANNEQDTFLSYEELAEQLIPYVLDLGYTHIELLPVMEHPYDGSWGYQVTGYFSSTSRYGTPQQLMAFIDKCHHVGIGVILDWVPGHFCKDSHGLGRFDGTSLYEADVHEQWGTYKFDFSRTEVWSFLISNALFWFDQYHIEGLRVDGVSSMLYLDYGKEGRSWKRNSQGGREDLAAIAFLRQLNEVVFHYYPEALMIAEEATDWPLVSWPEELGGLSFNYKWNMGWMNDTLHYLELDFDERPKHHQQLTFSMMYAFAENFILPLSHDEVVHGKKSLLSKMPGNYEQKFAGLRSLYCYFICHPGKKLCFMGGEFAQFSEWRFDHELDWLLLNYEMHRKHQDFTRALNQLYRNERSLWENDHNWSGFSWIDATNSKQSILVFCRYSHCQDKVDPHEFLIVLINFQPVAYEKFRIGAPRLGLYSEIFSSDQHAFGGSHLLNPGFLCAQNVPWHNQKYSLEIRVPPLASVIFKPLIHKHDSTLIFHEGSGSSGK